MECFSRILHSEKSLACVLVFSFKLMVDDLYVNDGLFNINETRQHCRMLNLRRNKSPILIFRYKTLTTLTSFLYFSFFQADASLGMLEREYLRESLSYVLAIQDVQERIKFEFVEILLGFMSGWLVFYHLGHEVAEDAKEYMTDLQHKVQKVIDTFFTFLTWFFQ